MELPDPIKKPLDVIGNAIGERFRNPFVSAFIISWALFNWKAIIYLLFGVQPIESRITYIETHFTDIYCYLWFPLCSAIFYSIALPYIGTFINWLIKFSVLTKNKSLQIKRLQAIADKQEIAIAEIAFEEKKTEQRERKAHNKLVEDLQLKNKDLEVQLETLSADTKASYDALRDRTAEMSKSYVTEREGLLGDIGKLQEQLHEYQVKAQDDKQTINELAAMVPKNKPRLEEHIIKLENGTEIIEQNTGQKTIYLSIDRNKMYSPQEVAALLAIPMVKKTLLPI